jgi:hypothetical protein
MGICFLSLFLSPLVGFVVALAMSPDVKKVADARGGARSGNRTPGKCALTYYAPPARATGKPWCGLPSALTRH